MILLYSFRSFTQANWHGCHWIGFESKIIKFFQNKLSRIHNIDHWIVDLFGPSSFPYLQCGTSCSSKVALPFGSNGDHVFGTYAKFSEKLLFLITWYAPEPLYWGSTWEGLHLFSPPLKVASSMVEALGKRKRQNEMLNIF